MTEEGEMKHGFTAAKYAFVIGGGPPGVERYPWGVSGEGRVTGRTIGRAIGRAIGRQRAGAIWSRGWTCTWGTVKARIGVVTPGTVGNKACHVTASFLIDPVFVPGHTGVNARLLSYSASKAPAHNSTLDPDIVELGHHWPT